MVAPLSLLAISGHDRAEGEHLRPRGTKLTGAAYRLGAAGPAFTRFLERVPPDPAMRAFLGRLLGHALEGRVVSHILPIFYGEGGNGKGTLINHAVLPALGDYADAADAGLLTARK